MDKLDIKLVALENVLDLYGRPMIVKGHTYTPRVHRENDRFETITYYIEEVDRWCKSKYFREVKEHRNNVLDELLR